jgi:hypothetical protein
MGGEGEGDFRVEEIIPRFEKSGAFKTEIFWILGWNCCCCRDHRGEQVRWGDGEGQVV